MKATEKNSLQKTRADYHLQHYRAVLGQEEKPMKKLMLVILLLVTAVSCGGAAAAEPTAVPTPEATQTCAESTADYRDAVDDLLTTWDDTNALASSTSRINLSGPVGDLQQIARDVEAMDVPPCAEKAHQLLSDYMRRLIDGYLAFMAQEANANNKISQANNILQQWAEEYATLTSE